MRFEESYERMSDQVAVSLPVMRMSLDGGRVHDVSLMDAFDDRHVRVVNSL